ncbi:MAG: methyltransferase [Methylococcales bacterium]|nr:methyltransferase [Methylococcales bacterium]
MKVCTDSLLFGAMAPVTPDDRVLDIGAGSGLLALMAAQLGGGRITAVELCELASQEAASNFQHSRWAERLLTVNLSIQDFAAAADSDPAGRFDVIISNPPFFADHLPSANPQKRLARHNQALPYPELIAAADRLLAANGVFYVLLPCHAAALFCELAGKYGLFPQTRLDYQGFAHTPAKVSALCFTRSATVCQTAGITVYAASQVYTEASRRYLQAFLPRFGG